MCYSVFMADTVAISVRIPKVLLGKLDQSAAEADRSRNWIIVDALEMVYEEIGGGSSVVEQRASSPKVAASITAPRSKPDMAALRAICAGTVAPALTDEDRAAASPAHEIPICGKTWWEDGEQYECLMDNGHKEAKHGMRGMVRRLEL